MPETVFITTLLACLAVYRWLCKARLVRVWWLAVIVPIYVGSLMNLIATRANGGQMPVADAHVDWDTAPNLRVPGAWVDIFARSLVGVQRFVMARDDVHRWVPQEEYRKLRLLFLADRHPLKVNNRYHWTYSLGDVCVLIGIVTLVVGAAPVGILCKRKARVEADEHGKRDGPE